MMSGSKVYVLVCVCLIGGVFSDAPDERPEVRVFTGTARDTAEPINVNCTERLLKCYNGSVFVPIHGEGPIRPHPSRYSNLIRYLRKYSASPNLHVPIGLNQEFIEHLALLYNNDDQLRVLLTLLRSDQRKDWLTFLGGYGRCDDFRPAVFTCINDTCSHNDLLSLDYTHDIFTEDVVGLELSPPKAFVLVLVRNNQTRKRKILRISTESMSLLDATYNLMHAVLGLTRLDSRLSQTLLAYRHQFPAAFPAAETIKLSTRHHRKGRPDHGPAAVDAKAHRRA